MRALLLFYNKFTMPELPEVETIRRGLSNKILNKQIVNIDIKKPNLVRNKVANFKASLKDNAILSIDRIGKLLILDLADKNFLLIHLKMTGQLIYSSKDDLIAGGHNFPSVDNLPNKYSYIIFNNSLIDIGELVPALNICPLILTGSFFNSIAINIYRSITSST